MKKAFLKKASILAFVVTLALSGNFFFSHRPQKANAATFSMQTGYYIGNGATLSITGLGSNPLDLVIIKADTTAGAGAVWATSAMTSGHTAFFTNAVDDTTGFITLGTGQFALSSNADVNTAGVRYTYITFSGSDCSSTGTFCVGSYAGNGSSGNAITSVGFQPDLVWIKKSATPTEYAVWKSSSMATNTTQYFYSTAQLTTNAYIQTLNPTGFTLGNNAFVNTSAATYWYVAFKQVSGAMSVGSFTGTGAATSTTGLGFSPDFVIFKNASSTQAAGYNVTQSDGNYSSLFTDAANATQDVTSLDSGGFTVGTGAGANGSGLPIYWAAFGGAPPASGSGSFVMANGTYTGTGSSQSTTGLSFSPNLVIIGTDSQDDAFRTSEMKGDDTGLFSSTTADFAGGITSLDSNGFTVGTSPITNNVGSVYYWTAFGNAWNPETHIGSADFEVGAYTGSGVARSILNIPFAPDMVVTKRNGGSAGNWSTSGMTAGYTQFFGGTAQNAAGAEFTSLNTDSFSLGTNANANAAGSVYNWFAFKADGNFITGSYTGNSTNGHTITGLGFQPDLVWAKRITNTVGAFTMSSAPVGTSLRFGTGANSTSDFTNLTSDGFVLGTGAEVNTASTYWYAAWQGKAYNESAYRLFANQNSTDVGSPLAAQNTTSVLLSPGSPFRLRMLLQLGNDTLFTSGQNFKLQFGTGTVCSSTSYSDVTTSTVIAYYNNTSTVDGSALTADGNDPINGTDVIDNQTYDQSNPFTNSQSAIVNGQDGKWDFSLFDNGAPSGTAYCFRAVKSNGNTLDAYTVYPAIVTATSTTSLLTISNVQLNSNSVITLTPNTTTTVTITASTTAGSNPISFATAAIYRTSLGSSCTANNRNCYQIASSSCAFSGSTTTVTCTAGLWYFADSTGNAWASYPSDSWTGSITVTDSGNNPVSANSSPENVGVLAAINVTTSTINYGTITPSSTTGSTNQVVTVQNAGNISTTLQVYGTALKSGSNLIATSSQHYATSTFTFGGLEPALSDTASTVSGFSLVTPTSTTPVQASLYWGLGVSNGAHSGTYSGGVTFVALPIITGTSQPVVFDSIATGTVTGAVNSITFPLTVTSTNQRALGVWIVVSGNSGIAQATVSSVTYAGVNLYQVLHESPDVGYLMDLWSLPAGTQPTSGTNNVVITLSGNMTSIGGGSPRMFAAAISAVGVNQTQTWDATSTNSGLSTSPSLTLGSTGSNDLIIDAVCNGTSVGNAGGSQTKIYAGPTDTNTACGSDAGSRSAGGTTNLSYTTGNDYWILSGAAFKAASNLYAYSRSITVTSTPSVASGTNINFPLLVSSTLASWAAPGYGGHVQNLCTAPNGGQEPCDLVFATSTANCIIAPLNFETESYTSSTGALVDWVNVPSLSAGTTIYACYGDSAISTDQSHPSLTWNSNYAFVAHLAAPTGTLQTNDSTANAITGTNYGATAGTGEIDGGGDFVSTSSQYIEYGHPTSTQITNNITMEGWVNMTSSVATGLSWFNNQFIAGSNTGIFTILNQAGTNQISIYVGNGTTNSEWTLGLQLINNGVWHHIVTTFASGQEQIFLDGVLTGTTTAGNSITSIAYSNSVSGLRLGSNGANNAWFPGDEDEMRISNVVLSPSWILTEYKNESNPSSFYAVGNETAL